MDANGVRAVGLRAKDSKGIRSYKHFFELLSDHVEGVPLGGGWRAVFSTEFLEFYLVNDKYKSMFPHGIECCPIAGCELSPETYYCMHSGYDFSIPPGHIFRDNEFDEDDFLTIAEALEKSYGLPFWNIDGQAWTDSVVGRLKSTGADHELPDLGVSVKMEGESMKVTLNRNGLCFYSCAKKDCYKQGICSIKDGQVCPGHKEKFARFTGTQSREYMSMAFRMLVARVNETVAPKGTELSIAKQTKNVLLFLWMRGAKGYEFNFPNGCSITFKVSNDCHLFYQTTEKHNNLYICANYHCLKPVRTRVRTESSQLFCKECTDRDAVLNVTDIVSTVPYGKETNNEA